MALISRFPDWLYNGLKLTEPKIPLQLGEDAVFPVLDIAQGGRGFSVYDPIEVIQPASTPAQDRIVIPADEELIQLIWFMTWLNSKAIPSLAEMTIRDTGGTGRVIFYTRFSAGVGILLRSTDNGLFGFAPIFIPPRWEVVVTFGLTGVAESEVLTMLVERIPRGFQANL